jgi:hypothetical protein
MKDFKVLRILDKFQRLYKKLGVNYTTMRIILQIKLTLDDVRRVSTVMKNNKNTDDSKVSSKESICQLEV